MESSQERKEIDAFFSFLGTFPLSHPATSLTDLSDGTALFEVLSCVDPDYFRQPTRPYVQQSENWVLRFNVLKRLYRLMTQYITDVLQKPTAALRVPDLQVIAKDYSLSETLVICRLAIAIGVQCEKNKLFIEKIQGLSEADQHHLMKAIEQVISRISNATPSVQDSGEPNMTEDDHFYRMQFERSQCYSEKETLEGVYEALIEEHRNLQSSFDDIMHEKEEALAHLRELSQVDSRRNDKADNMMRVEMERLRTELQKSEDNLAIAESELDKHTNLVSELKKKIDDLQVQADLAAKLKDQLDEYRHAADKLQKTENVMEKYKRKLQEGADLRQRVKALEKQNADLIDKSASQEEEYRKVAAFKPLMESYKNQIADLEMKYSARSQEMETLKFELDENRTKLKIMAEERARDAETLELYQERVRELELTSQKPVRSSGSRRIDCPDSSTNVAELNTSAKDGTSDVDSDDHSGLGLDGELDDAIAGTTMTDLKLKVRKLTRELEAVRKNEAEASRILVLENLLEDANRMKTRYENDYLNVHREKLVLLRNLDDIRNGKSFGDGAEAAIALRQRLNETTEQFEILRKDHAELEVKLLAQSEELMIVKADLTLVNRDQLDILATLRDSVNEDKAKLETEIDHLKNQNRDLGDKNRMQLEQINTLLLDKVSLQTEGIDHREQMLQRERAFGDLRAAMSGKDIPEDLRLKMLALHEENISLRGSNKTTQEKLAKARQFIRAQDKLFKEQHASSISSFPRSEEADIKTLEDATRQMHLVVDATARYRREHELMSSLIHHICMPRIRTNLGGSYLTRPEPYSWLGIQRKNVSHSLERK